LRQTRPYHIPIGCFNFFEPQLYHLCRRVARSFPMYAYQSYTCDYFHHMTRLRHVCLSARHPTATSSCLTLSVVLLNNCLVLFYTCSMIRVSFICCLQIALHISSAQISSRLSPRILCWISAGCPKAASLTMLVSLMWQIVSWFDRWPYVSLWSCLRGGRRESLLGLHDLERPGYGIWDL
jgi:hypothetical protein